MNIKIIENKKTLFEILRNKNVVSYINYYNIYSIDLKTFYKKMYFHIDSSFLSNIVGVDRLNGDFSGFMYELIASYDSVFFIGGTENENTKFLDLISNLYPNKNIDGIQGYTLNINSLKSRIIGFDLIIVSAGFPLQEKLAQTLHNENSILCTGAFISQYCTGEYYPDFVKKYDIRFLYRLFREKGARKKFLKIFKNFIFVKMGYFKYKFLIVNNLN